ncbi:hypothetical protein BBJ28_00015114 [Nothophytophthora sp. Chile5]|nr:hypothetical protein BBJ28_00015114 [Nothophytophthora sp. Chile5]
MRHVPGPLHDVMKKQADQCVLVVMLACYCSSLGDRSSQMASASSDRFSVAIVTVFDQGPWVDMCQYLGMAATPGKLYGNIKIGSLKCTLRDIVEDDQALSKVPQVKSQICFSRRTRCSFRQLLVLIKSLRYVDEEIVAVLQDPTGEIEGYFHRELVEQLGPALAAGVGVLLYKVSVFTPTDAPVTGKRKSYLNITPRNVRRVFVTKEQANSSSSDATVALFNQAKQDEAEDDSDNDDYDDSQSTSSQQAGRQLLQHNAIRDTSAELTFLSQRQVIHRNPPVRVDPAAAATAKKGKRGKKAAGKTQENSTGLGRWQWSKLLKKNADNNPDEASSAAAQPRQDTDVSLDASSRLASLISRQSSRNSRNMPEAKAKDLDARLRALQTKALLEERDWDEEARKLYEFEDKFLRDTLLEGNILTGWGEPRTAPVRFHNAGVRKRKRERQEATAMAAAERAGKRYVPIAAELTVEEQLKVDRHRLASYSSLTSAAEPLHATLDERERQLAQARSKKPRKEQTGGASAK